MRHLNHSCLTFQLHETSVAADSDRIRAPSIAPPSQTPLPPESKESAYLGEKETREGRRVIQMATLRLADLHFSFSCFFFPPPMQTQYNMYTVQFPHEA